MIFPAVPQNFASGQEVAHKELPSPKLCADCGGFLPASMDEDALQFFDHSTFCTCARWRA